MTDTQSLMLACCFGVAVGTTIGNLLSLVWMFYDARREKRKREQEQKRAEAEARAMKLK